MKTGPVAPMPWDMIMFLAVTAVGFGISVQKIVHPEKSVIAVSAALSAAAATSGAPSQAILNLGCVERKLREAVTSHGGSIRLRGKFCHVSASEMKRFGSLRVRNLTTGKEGTVFFQGEHSAFITDAVVLKSGQNLIQVEWKETKTAPSRMYVAEVFEK